MRVIHPICAAIAALVVCTAGESRADVGAVRRFGDRPVAWEEHDDGDVKTLPKANHLQELLTTLALRDGLSNEVDRILSLDGREPALDVNAADEVPCSTWFCARNHLHPMTPEETAAGRLLGPRRRPS